VEVRRVQLKGIRADGAGRNAECASQRDAQMREIAADARAVYKRPLRGRLSVDRLRPAARPKNLAKVDLGASLTLVFSIA